MIIYAFLSILKQQIKLRNSVNFWKNVVTELYVKSWCTIFDIKVINHSLISYQHICGKNALEEFPKLLS